MSSCCEHNESETDVFPGCCPAGRAEVAVRRVCLESAAAAMLICGDTSVVFADPSLTAAQVECAAMVVDLGAHLIPPESRRRTR